MMATARVQPADARSIFTGKHETVNPVRAAIADGAGADQFVRHGEQNPPLAHRRA
jgi:hypothetical protein